MRFDWANWAFDDLDVTNSDFRSASWFKTKAYLKFDARAVKLGDFMFTNWATSSAD